MPATAPSTFDACLMLTTKLVKFMSYYHIIIDAETKTYKMMPIVLHFVRSENYVYGASQCWGLAFIMWEFWIFVGSLVGAQEFANLFPSGSIQCALTGVLHFALANMFLRFIHVCVYLFFVPFFCCLVFHCMFIPHLLHSPFVDILVVSSWSY